MQKTIRIRNLDCAACAAELSEELCGLEGIEAAEVDFINQRVALTYRDDAALARAIDCITHFEEVELAEEETPKKERHIKEILSIAVSALFFLPALILSFFFQNADMGWKYWLWVSFFLVSFAAAGWSVVVTVVMNFPRVFKGGFHLHVLLDENLLMTVAAAGALAIGEYMEAAAVMLLYEIGELLQTIAVGSSRGAIAKLLEMKSKTAILLGEEGQKEVDAETLKPGDVVLLRKGDLVPADCVLLSEMTVLDVKSLTGEAAPKEAMAGCELLAGSVNMGEAVKARVLRPATESAVAKILDMVENSSAKKARPEKFITKFARIYTPIVVLLAVLIAVVPPLFQEFNFTTWLVPAIEFLVISCPCALIISVPLTYFAGVGTLARHGILTKGAVCLDTLAKAEVAVFDKTGTLTEGKFSILRTHGDARALQLAAAVERHSSHPLAEAFAGVASALVAEDVCERSGMGLSATVEGKRVLVGNLRLMQADGVEVPAIDTVSSLIYVAEGGTYVGAAEIEDAVRSDAKGTLEDLKRYGIGYRAVLTGDSETRAKEVLQGLPLEEITANLLPAEKAEHAEALKTRGTLLYVGDGINDTPVMAAADVSVAMGGLGSDAAIEASDLVLASDSLSALPKAYRGAKKTRRIVTENIVFSLVVKLALMAVSVVATATARFELPIWAAVFGDVGVMLLAVLNALRMRRKL